MEIIAFILMIVFALVSAGERKKKAAKRADAQQQAGNPQAARPQAVARPQAAAQPQAVKPVSQMSLAEREARMKTLREKQAARQAGRPAGDVKAALDTTLTELKTLLTVEPQAAPAEGDSLLADADCHGGSMPHTHAEGGSTLDDEECVGGSMAHSHAEGQSRAEQRRRLSDLDRRREAEHGAPEGLFPKAIDAAAMRRAVVMAVVLGKPKSLQRSKFVA